MSGASTEFKASCLAQGLETGTTLGPRPGPLRQGVGATVGGIAASQGYTHGLSVVFQQQESPAFRIAGVEISPALQPSAVSPAQTKDPETLTQNDFAELARSSPRLLVAHVSSGRLRPAQLTFAAECLGSLVDAALAEASLLPLSRSDSALVREGAAYGLAKLRSPAAKARLQELAADDTSLGVREAATEALEL